MGTCRLEATCVSLLDKARFVPSVNVIEACDPGRYASPLEQKHVRGASRLHEDPRSPEHRVDSNRAANRTPWTTRELAWIPGSLSFRRIRHAFNPPDAIRQLR